MERIRQILMRRDGVSSRVADQLVRDAKVRVFNGENPEKILYKRFWLRARLYI